MSSQAETQHSPVDGLSGAAPLAMVRPRVSPARILQSRDPDVDHARALSTREGRKEAKRHLLQMHKIMNDTMQEAARIQGVMALGVHTHDKGADALGAIDRKHVDMDAELRLMRSREGLSLLTEAMIDDTVGNALRTYRAATDRLV